MTSVNFGKTFFRSVHHSLTKSTLSTSCVCLSLKEYIQLQKLSKQLIELNPKDLKRSTAKGSGPGGQKVNKTENCVRLKHIPTNITVKAHESRSLEENHNIALLKLRVKVDIHLKGQESIISKIKVDNYKLKMAKKSFHKERMEKIEAFKNANPEDDIDYY